jgi:hypothetical protein
MLDNVHDFDFLVAAKDAEVLSLSVVEVRAPVRVLAPFGKPVTDSRCWDVESFLDPDAVATDPMVKARKMRSAIWHPLDEEWWYFRVPPTSRRPVGLRAAS